MPALVAGVTTPVTAGVDKFGSQGCDRRAVRHCDGIAPECDEACFCPRLQPSPGALSVPSPAATKLGRRQRGAPAWLTAQPFERRRFVERTDRYDICHHVSPHYFQKLLNRVA